MYVFNKKMYRMNKGKKMTNKPGSPLEISSKNISKICTDPKKRSGLFKLWHTHVTAVHIVQCPIAIALYYVPSGEI